VTASEKGWD